MDDQEEAAGGSKSNDVASICVLCDQPMTRETSCTIGERAINNVIEASKKRKDRKHLRIANRRSLLVHENCRKSYTKAKNIETAAKSMSDQLTRTRLINAEARKFDFETTYFFCNKKAIFTETRVKIKSVALSNTREKILETLKTRPDNEFNQNLKARLETAKDLKGVNARYHADCMRTFYVSCIGNLSVRQADSNTLNAIDFIEDYLKNHAHECQFSFNELRDKYTGVMPDVGRMRKELMERFGDNLCLHTMKNDLIMCSRVAVNKIVTDYWQKNNSGTLEEKENQIIDLASDIIRRDIRSKPYDITDYRAPSKVLDGIDNDIPTTLKRFKSNVIVKDKCINREDTRVKWNRRVATICHSIILSLQSCDSNDRGECVLDSDNDEDESDASEIEDPIANKRPRL